MKRYISEDKLLEIFETIDLSENKVEWIDIIKQLLDNVAEDTEVINLVGGTQKGKKKKKKKGRTSTQTLGSSSDTRSSLSEIQSNISTEINQEIRDQEQLEINSQMNAEAQMFEQASLEQMADRFTDHDLGKADDEEIQRQADSETDSDINKDIDTTWAVDTGELTTNLTENATGTEDDDDQADDHKLDLSPDDAGDEEPDIFTDLPDFAQLPTGWTPEYRKAIKKQHGGLKEVFIPYIMKEDGDTSKEPSGYNEGYGILVNKTKLKQWVLGIIGKKHEDGFNFTVSKSNFTSSITSVRKKAYFQKKKGEEWKFINTSPPGAETFKDPHGEKNPSDVFNKNVDNKPDTKIFDIKKNEKNQINVEGGKFSVNEKKILDEDYECIEIHMDNRVGGDNIATPLGAYFYPTRLKKYGIFPKTSNASLCSWLQACFLQDPETTVAWLDPVYDRSDPNKKYQCDYKIGIGNTESVSHMGGDTAESLSIRKIWMGGEKGLPPSAPSDSSKWNIIRSYYKSWGGCDDVTKWGGEYECVQSFKYLIPGDLGYIWGNRLNEELIKLNTKFIDVNGINLQVTQAGKASLSNIPLLTELNSSSNFHTNFPDKYKVIPLPITDNLRPTMYNQILGTPKIPLTQLFEVSKSFSFNSSTFATAGRQCIRALLLNKELNITNYPDYDDLSKVVSKVLYENKEQKLIDYDLKPFDLFQTETDDFWIKNKLGDQLSNTNFLNKIKFLINKYAFSTELMILTELPMIPVADRGLMNRLLCGDAPYTSPSLTKIGHYTKNGKKFTVPGFMTCDTVEYAIPMNIKHLKNHIKKRDGSDIKEDDNNPACIVVWLKKFTLPSHYGTYIKPVDDIRGESMITYGWDYRDSINTPLDSKEYESIKMKLNAQEKLDINDRERYVMVLGDIDKDRDNIIDSFQTTLSCKPINWIKYKKNLYRRYGGDPEKDDYVELTDSIINSPSGTSAQGWDINGHNFRCWVKKNLDPKHGDKYMSDINSKLTGWIYDATHNPDENPPTISTPTISTTTISTPTISTTTISTPTTSGGGIMEEATENCSIS